MRMVLVTSGFGPRFGGIGVVAAAIREALAPEMEVTIWRHRPNWPVGIRSLALVLRAMAGLGRRPDFIVFTHIDLARLMLVIPLLRRIPFVIVLYGVEVWRPLDASRRHCLERAAAVVAISEYTVRKAREMNPWLRDPHIVWLGVADRGIRVSQEIKPTVLILGRMASSERYKGHDEIIEAWPRVVAEVPEAELLIVGEGDDRARLEARASGAASIRFTGYVSDEARQQLLRSSAVLVSISSGEGFGLAAVEAASSGVPVVALRGTVTDELFPGGCGHVLLDSTRPEPLARALIALLNDPNRARAIGAAGAERVREAFTLDHFYRRVRAAITPDLARPREQSVR
jgi:phosphatidylinositol alpha-1,6-mannosyltransferase